MGVTKYPVYVVGIVAALIAFQGCDVFVRPAKDRATERRNVSSRIEEASFEKLETELAVLEGDLASVDRTLSADVSKLREELKMKVDKSNVKEVVESKLAQIRGRLDVLDHRNDRIERRLRKIEQHLGIFERRPEAPWYGKKTGS